MRRLITLSAAVVLLGGCAKTTAFEFFKMDALHERAASNLRSERVVQDNETRAIISSVYLNRVMPEAFGDKESFYIAVYMRDKGEIYTQSGEAVPENRLLLNGLLPLRVENADENGTLRSLMPLKNEWNRYYIVEYAHSDETLLTLTFESDRFGKVDLVYRRDDE